MNDDTPTGIEQVVIPVAPLSSLTLNTSPEAAPDVVLRTAVPLEEAVAVTVESNVLFLLSSPVTMLPLAV